VIRRLSVLSYDLERARQWVLGNPAAVARLEHAKAALASEVQGLRELMSSLRPPTLDEVGLEAALRDQVGAFTRHTGVDCAVRVALAGRLDTELETIVYRVTQEALLNVSRHARATRLWLELEGVGDHFGLVAMRERVELAGGRFQLESRPAAGVVVRASFDLPSAA
jgi:two-component system sensor histidine kinase UhpB